MSMLFSPALLVTAKCSQVGTPEGGTPKEVKAPFPDVYISTPAGLRRVREAAPRVTGIKGATCIFHTP